MELGFLKADGRNEKKESGMIVVETVISFTVFLVTIFSIAYFTNMLILHNKIQFAINSAAHELASYTYLYAAFGGRAAEQTIRSDGAENTGKIDGAVSSAYSSYQKVVAAKGSAEAAVGEVVNFLPQLQGDGQDGGTETEGLDLEALGKQLDSVGQSLTEAGEAVESAAGQVKDTVEKVKGLMQDKEGLIGGMAYIGLEGAEYAAKDLLGTGAAWLLTRGYIAQNDQIGGKNLSADDWLKANGVKDGYGGLDFGGSTLFCDEDFRMIDIVVEYDVEVGFVRLILPDNVKLHMVNRVTIPAWLDGDGVQVEPGA